jgi:hypothetical protein
MAAIASGLNFSTLNQEGIALNVCNTVNLTVNPEYPALPFTFGTRTIGLDGSTWVFAKPQPGGNNLVVGTVGYLDTSWNFYPISVANALTTSGLTIGVLSQIGTTTATPTSSVYDGVWVQLSGLCPAIMVAASASANVQLYPLAVDSARTITAMTGPTAVGAAGNQYVITATSAPSYPIGTLITVASASPTTLNTTYVVSALNTAGSYTVTSITATGTWSSSGTATGTIQGVLNSSGTTPINGIVITAANGTQANAVTGFLNFPEVNLTT